MQTRKRRIGIWQWGLGLVVVLALAGPAAAAQQYQFTDLGNLPDQVSSIALDINNKGQIIGESWDPATGRAFLKNPGEPMQDLGTLPGYGDNPYVASAINDQGTIVGYCAPWPYHPFIKYPGQPMEDALGGMVEIPPISIIWGNLWSMSGNTKLI